jgi:two-component system response regulator HydG
MSYMIHSPNPVLLVDDEQVMLVSARMMLNSAGIDNVITTDDSRQVMSFLSEQEVSAIVLDLSMPYLSGKELLVEINHEYPHTPVIIMTATNELETAVECMKSGAFDYLVKPVEAGQFLSSLQRALEMYELRNEVSLLKEHLLSDQLENESAFSKIITRNKRMRSIFKYIEAISRSRQPVLITGETGVGKELIARAVHELSGREGEFIAINIAGLDDTVFSDTLFGHKRGAFTGAEKDREGLISRADGGTLFFDEIGDMNELSQIKLLRVLQEQKYYQLGSDVLKQSDVRIIVATNQDLQKSIEKKKFRKDLYYRLRTHHIHIPPLRERIEDIPLLIGYFLDKASHSMHKKKPKSPSELEILLSNYRFPGNIRELQSMVFDAVAQHRSGILSMDSFKIIINQEQLSHQKNVLQPEEHKTQSLLNITDHFPTLKEAENFLVNEAIRRSKGNQGIAASLLGITRQALNRRLQKKKKVVSSR